LEEFSWQNALSLAVASKIAYRRDVVAVKSLAKSGWGFSGCETFDCQETQGFVCWDDRVVVLAYRGTEQNLADWIRNLDVVSTDRPRYGAVHAGFYNGFNVAQDAVEGILNSIDRIGEKTLWVTGHSLGGALSVIAAAEFQGRYKVAGVYTYGQPKVGRDLLEGFYDTHFKGRLHRVINHEDVVPMVPPFYQHFGELYHFDGNADLAAALAGLSAGEASVSSEPVRELSKPEFDELQVKMDALCEPAIPGALALPPSEPEIEVNAALFGVSVSDHDLGKGYIPKVRAQRLRS
jgi:pimeloyl-ACP methyl ester carboxylesterase